MNTDLSSRPKCKERPFDPKCKKLVPLDPVVEEQIRCRVRRWSGDFREVIPEVTAGGVRLADLPLLTVHDVGQYAIRAAQGGSLRAGPVGTTAGTVVALSPAAVESVAMADDEYATIARKLSAKPRRVLWFMRENNASRMVDGLTRQFIADGLGISIDDVAEVCKTLRDCGKTLYESKRGCAGRVWLTPDGLRVAEHCAPADLIAATLKKRA
jgi:hypothetical protein